MKHSIYLKGYNRNHKVGDRVKIRLTPEGDKIPATIVKVEFDTYLMRKPGGNKVRMPQTILVVEA